MNVNQRIMEALEGFGYPVVPNVYTGAESTYFTFSYNTAPSDFTDDRPQMERYSIQVHFFSPATADIAAVQKQIKQRLFSAGGAWPEMENASGADLQHFIFKWEWTEAIMMEESMMAERLGKVR